MLIMYRKIKLYQIFFPPPAAVHQRAGFSLEYQFGASFGYLLHRKETIRRAGWVTAAQEDEIKGPLT